jgi:uncharacterized protein (DUF2147 family)
MMPRAVRLAGLTVLVAVAAGSPAHAQDASDDVVGLWVTEPEEDGQFSRVEIYPCGDRYCGRIVWLSHPTVQEWEDPDNVGGEKLDANNPDEELRGRPILGLELMHSFRFDDGSWKDGRIYDPAAGKEYRCEMKFAEDGERLEVRGFIKIAFAKVGRTTRWTRFAEEDAESSGSSDP